MYTSLKGGTIVKTGDISLADTIEKNGYDSINEVRKEENYA